MPSIRFHSLRSRSFTVSVSQSGLQAEVSVPELPPDSSGQLFPQIEKVGTVTIESNRPVDAQNRPWATAPGGFLFTARAEGFVSSDPNFEAWKDLHYTWSFDDPGWYTRHDTDDLPWGKCYRIVGDEVVRSVDGRVPTGAIEFLGNDKNVAYGPWVAHVFAPEAEAFDRASEKIFRVRCEVRTAPTEEPILTAEREVKLKNPDSVFARGRTILVSAEGDTGNPNDPVWEPERFPGATLANTHLQALQRASPQSTGPDWPVRFLFRRGQTHTLADSQAQSYRAGHFGNAQVGAYGTGTPPVLSGPLDLWHGTLMDDEAEGAWWGFDRPGPYDATDPLSTAGVRPEGGLGLSYGKYKTVWDVSITGWNVCLSAAPNKYYPQNDRSLAGFDNAVIGNTFIGSWANYGIFAHGSPKNFGQCGVWIKQPLGTFTHAGRDEAGEPIFADHGPLRCNEPGSPSAFNLVDYRSLNSWAGKFQPCTRWNIGSTIVDCPNKGDLPHYNWDRARFEGGRGIYQPTSAASGLPGDLAYAPARGLWDKIYHVPYIAEDNPAAIQISGPVVRNAIVVLPDQPQMATNSFPAVITGRGSGPDPANPSWDPRVVEFGIEIYSNTVADLRSYAVPGWVGILDPKEFQWWKYFVNDNNVLHAPHRPDVTGEEHVGDLDATALWAVEFEGLRYGLDPLKEMYSLKDKTTARRLTPSSTSEAYRSVGMSSADEKESSGPTSKVAVDDFFGRLRKGLPSQGAVEPD